MNTVQLLVGTTQGLFIYRTATARQVWQMEGPLLADWSIDSVLGDSRHGGRIFVGASHPAQAPTLFLSQDQGATWTQVEPGPRFAKESGLTLRSIWQITPGAPTQPDTYYAGVDEAGLFVSQDRGHTWDEVLGLNRHPTRAGWRGSRGGLPLHTICIDPTDPRRMWVAISAAGILRSEDSGQSWQLANGGLRPITVAGADGFLVHKLVLDPHDANVLYLQDLAGFYRSTDGARSWQPWEDGLPSTFGFPLGVDGTGALFAVPLDMNTRAFINGAMTVFRRRRQDDAWQPLTQGLPSEPQVTGVLRDALAVDSLTPTGVYLGTTTGELYGSANDGEDWQRLPGQLSRITALRAWVVDDAAG